MNSTGKYDIVGRAYLWFAISGLVILIGMVGFVGKAIRARDVRVAINAGVDFTGGAMYRYQLPRAVGDLEGRKYQESVRKALHAAGLKKIGALQVSDRTVLFIRTGEHRDQAALVASVLAKLFGQKETIVLEHLNREFVGPVIGRELTRQAIMGTIVGLLGIMVWIWIRYNVSGDGFRYAVAGMVSLVHDVLVMVGGFAIAGIIWPSIEADSSFVAAILTVVGYSINDTVVIFDRIRENLKHRRRDPFADVVNDSLWQTMARSINTVATVLFALTILVFFGGESVRSFSLAMLIGIASGAYSSILNASPILVVWKKWDEQRQKDATAVPPRRPPPPSATPATPTRVKSELPAQPLTPMDGDAQTNGFAVPVGAMQDEKDEAERRRRLAAKRGNRKRRF